jgi:hypothetical protein
MAENPEQEGSEATWAMTEFGAALLGDARRTARLVRVAETLGARPSASLPDACADRAQLKAAYRFFANDAVEPAALLAPHAEATIARLAQQALVLAVQDTTELDFTHHPATSGLGALSDTSHQGLFVHSTLAFTPDRVPLGVLAQQVWRRDPATLGQQPDHKTRPIAEKESQKWLTSLRAVVAVAARCPATHLVSVGDREADVYDLFLEPRPAGVDLLVRAVQNRRVEAEAGYLWAAVAAAPAATTVSLAVPRQGGRPARTATLTLRWAALTLRAHASRGRALAQRPGLVVWARRSAHRRASRRWTGGCSLPARRHRRRGARPAGVVCLPLGIEVWHKVLKSGCRIEARQLADAAHLRRSSPSRA